VRCSAGATTRSAGVIGLAPEGLRSGAWRAAAGAHGLVAFIAGEGAGATGGPTPDGHIEPGGRARAVRRLSSAAQRGTLVQRRNSFPGEMPHLRPAELCRCRAVADVAVKFGCCFSLTAIMVR
jgi:hypothetical protein